MILLPHLGKTLKACYCRQIKEIPSNGRTVSVFPDVELNHILKDKIFNEVQE